MPLKPLRNFRRRPHLRGASPQDFPLLRPFAREYWAAFDAVQDMSAEQLLAIEAEIASVTSTNCWFAIFEAACILGSVVQEEKHRRVIHAMRVTAGWQP